MRIRAFDAGESCSRVRTSRRLQVVILGTILFLAHPDLVRAQTIVNCEALGRPDIGVPLDSIVSNRLPGGLTQLDISSTCKQQFGPMASVWKGNDHADAATLVNRYCSARIGWREHRPGDCSAGGPPPICPVNYHWYRVSPQEGLSAFASRNDAVRWEREGKMRRAACACELQRLQQQLRKTEPGPARSAGSDFSIFSVPCSPTTEQCLPGASCVDGWCRWPAANTAFTYEFNSTVEESREAAGEVALSEGLQKGLTLALEQVSSTAGAVARSFWGGTAFGLMLDLTVFPKVTDLHITSYRQNATRLDHHTSEFTRVYGEYIQHLSGGDARPLPVIKEDLERVRREMLSTLAMMTHLMAGAVRQAELPASTCGNVAEFQHGQLARSVAELIALPVPQ